MKYRGINYDVGNNFRKGLSSRQEFDPAVVEKEIGIIRSELHCNAIRISGFDISRLVTASEFALKNNLTVFFSPSSINASLQETEEYILHSAEAAEQLRAKYGNVVFVTGCELSFFSRGFIAGDFPAARLQRLFGPLSLLLDRAGVPRGYNRKLGSFLAKIMPGIRERFGGEITYASGTWETVDWSLFDIVGIDHYRSLFNQSTYRDELKRYFRYNAPVVVLEFGCCCYRGAEDKGGAGWMIVDWDREQLNGDYTRDESVQADYLMQLLDIFSEEKVAGSFVFTFVQPSYVYNDDPRHDLDMASYGIVKMVKPPYRHLETDLPWIPKKAFSTVAAYYSRQEAPVFSIPDHDHLIV